MPAPLIMSHSLLWRHIVLLTVGVYSSNHRVLYTIWISMTRRFQKTVGPSVCNTQVLSMNVIFFLNSVENWKNIYFLENIASFSCRGCQALSSDMRITILLLIMWEEQAFLCKYVIFRKFALKFMEDNFLKISLHVLVEDAKPFHLICDLLFYCL